MGSRSIKVIGNGSIRKLGYTVSHSHSTATMVVSCIISKIKQDIGRKSRIFLTPFAFDALIRGLRRNIAMP